MNSREFKKYREQLLILRESFLEKPRLRNGRETLVTEKSKVFLREELYERVWSTPMHKLAKEFGYSDVGLAKLCEKQPDSQTRAWTLAARRIGSQATTYTAPCPRGINSLPN